MEKCLQRQHLRSTICQLALAANCTHENSGDQKFSDTVVWALEVVHRSLTSFNFRRGLKHVQWVRSD